MGITTIKSLCKYLAENSGFSSLTVRNVISSLGYRLSGTKNNFKELSGVFMDCSKHGADSGFCGFSNSCETIKFFKKHRQDIVSHMEQTAAELGSDIISLVQG